MDESTFAARLAETGAAIERELENVLGVEPRPGEPARPARLIAAMRYATLGGGKRVRPFLTVETARALGRADKGPRRAGVAIECVHAYSLIHDDLPAMDDDDLRRGRPSTHRAFDEATAILAGDALQALAFEILADPATDRKRRRARRPLCGPCARHRPCRDGRRADARHRRGAVNGAAFGRGDRAVAGDEDRRAAQVRVEAGTRLAGANPAASAALSTYGRAIGAAFQIADDILDVESDAATLGKRARKDAAQNKATLVGALGVEGARRELARLADEAESAVDAAGVGAAGDVLRATARFVATRKN